MGLSARRGSQSCGIAPVMLHVRTRTLTTSVLVCPRVISPRVACVRLRVPAAGADRHQSSSCC
ncbi:hypothetical protein POSPLADRAFT_1039978 [Postia placenta MAD-698-R-SB12]|uniref:Uncharacterized protein n=1 Tax=Postia placenta MAD-698-R-SB12 TaxID=670580 RepID=A0A1X6N0R2_9APHY|nr:hypothetical protein POSPLADRAFT_1039978 [Postia placenta MAD-698-R-SB12]OSX62219.1 hypothetical protein POSPLADRAFT_1039978 [Postia placenta MAD-698-R-SB12]